jgi:hypothetical protein
LTTPEYGWRIVPTRSLPHFTKRPNHILNLLAQTA